MDGVGYYAEALGRPDIDDITKLFCRLFDQNISAAYETNLSTGPTRLLDRFKSFNVIKIDINALPRSQLGAFNKLCHRNSRDKRTFKPVFWWPFPTDRCPRNGEVFARLPLDLGRSRAALNVSSKRFLGLCIGSQRQSGGTQTCRLCENGEPVYFAIFDGLDSVARATELHLSGHRLSRLPIAFGLHCVNCCLMDGLFG